MAVVSLTCTACGPALVGLLRLTDPPCGYHGLMTQMAHAIASDNLSHGVASGCSLLLQACFGWFTDIDWLSMACRYTCNTPVAPHSQQYGMHCFDISTTVSWVTRITSPSHHVMLTAILNFNPLLRMWADPSRKPSPILPSWTLMTPWSLSQRHQS